MTACPPATGISFRNRMLLDTFQALGLAAGGAAAGVGVGSLSTLSFPYCQACFIAYIHYIHATVYVPSSIFVYYHSSLYIPDKRMSGLKLREATALTPEYTRVAVRADVFLPPKADRELFQLSAAEMLDILAKPQDRKAIASVRSWRIRIPVVPGSAWPLLPSLSHVTIVVSSGSYWLSNSVTGFGSSDNMGSTLFGLTEGMVLLTGYAEAA